MDKTFYLDDNRISLKAKGILTIGLNGVNNFKEFCKLSKDGRDGIRSGIKELIDFHYCMYHACRNEDGRVESGKYYFVRYSNL